MATSTTGGHGRRAAGVASWVATAAAAVLAVGVLAGWWSAFEIQGGSMQPTIANGSLIVTRPVDVDQVHAGDIVSLVGPDGQRVTHRVVDVDAEGVTTRGDANDVDDARPYTGAHLDLVVWHVPGAGVLARLARTALTAPVLIALGVLITTALWPSRRRPTPAPVEAPAEDLAGAR